MNTIHQILDQRVARMKPAKSLAMALGLSILLPSVALASVPTTWSSQDCVGLDSRCTPGLALIFNNGIEGSVDVPLSGANTLYTRSVNGVGILERSSTHSREGGYSLRQRLTKNGVENYRQELRAKASTDAVTQAGSADYWMGISVYIPSSSSLTESVLFQWHGILKDAQNSSPTIGVRVKDGVWTMSREVGSRSGATMGSVAKDEWTDWVVHVRWRADKTGLIEIWKNGNLVVGGANWTNIQTGSAIDWQLPFFKFGRYSSAWKWNNDPNGMVHESYHDSLRICNAPTCTYNDVAPRGDRLTAK
jgi:hypothetical protein